MLVLRWHTHGCADTWDNVKQEVQQEPVKAQKPDDDDEGEAEMEFDVPPPVPAAKHAHHSSNNSHNLSSHISLVHSSHSVADVEADNSRTTDRNSSSVNLKRAHLQ